VGKKFVGLGKKSFNWGRGKSENRDHETTIMGEGFAFEKGNRDPAMTKSETSRRREEG